jgi:hypothetical protein
MNYLDRRNNCFVLTPFQLKHVTLWQEKEHTHGTNFNLSYPSILTKTIPAKVLLYQQPEVKRLARCKTT